MFYRRKAKTTKIIECFLSPWCMYKTKGKSEIQFLNYFHNHKKKTKQKKTNTNFCKIERKKNTQKTNNK